MNKVFHRFGFDLSRVPRSRRRDFVPSAKRSPAEVVAKLDPRFQATLLSMYEGNPQLGADGELHRLSEITSIAPEQGLVIYDLCLSIKPASTLEVGMAYGYSTLYFLAAAARNQSGFHTAIDPFQKSQWHAIGLVHATEHAPQWGETCCFSWIEERSDRAATDLARAGHSFDVIFIDGNHRFDDVLVDLYLYAQTCKIAGYILLDDMRMSSVQSAASFIRANRIDFREIPSAYGNVTIFQKIGEDTRSWNSFHKFMVSPSAFVAP